MLTCLHFHQAGLNLRVNAPLTKLDQSAALAGAHAVLSKEGRSHFFSMPKLRRYLNKLEAAITGTPFKATGFTVSTGSVPQLRLSTAEVGWLADVVVTLRLLTVTAKRLTVDPAIFVYPVCSRTTWLFADEHYEYAFSSHLLLLRDRLRGRTTTFDYESAVIIVNILMKRRHMPTPPDLVHRLDDADCDVLRYDCGQAPLPPPRSAADSFVWDDEGWRSLVATCALFISVANIFPCRCNRKSLLA